MTTPTPRTAASIKAGCEERALDARHSFGILYEYTEQLERDLAAAKDTISKYHERIISQHAQIDDLKWSLWKIEGKHKAAILEVITKLAAAQEALAVATRERNDAINASLADLTASQRAEALAAQNAKDAERYRFLRNTYPDYRGLVAVVDLSTDASAWLSHEYLDRAIDAAREGK